MKRNAAWMLLAALLLSACAAPAAEESGSVYRVYYPAAALESAAGMDAVVERSVTVPGEPTRQALAEALVRAMLSPPQTDVTSPLPAGTALEGVELTGRRAVVDFSGGYSELTGIALSLAECCLALTLTQLDGVDAVYVTEQGRSLPYRAQAFTAADALLGSMENPLRTFTVHLWFAARGTHEVRAERQTLLLREGEARLDVLLEALLLGPESDELISPFPEGFRVLSARAEDGVCYLNLPAGVPLPESAEEQRLLLDALVRSLCSLDSVDGVQIVLDGESAALLGTLPIDAVLYPEPDGPADPPPA